MVFTPKRVFSASKKEKIKRMKNDCINFNQKYNWSMRNFCIVSLCLFKVIAFSQIETIVEKKDTTIQQAKNIDAEVIICVYPSVPEFIGGQKAMFQFLSDNMKMPQFDSIRIKNLNKSSYTVYIGFTVSKNGEIKDVKTKRGISNFPEFENEAMRVVKLMSGKWTAAKRDRLFVDVNHTLPIKFRFE
jgi:Gram-negative bacterial TonB protein C-terminal